VCYTIYHIYNFNYIGGDIMYIIDALSDGIKHFWKIEDDRRKTYQDIIYTVKCILKDKYIMFSDYLNYSTYTEGKREVVVLSESISVEYIDEDVRLTYNKVNIDELFGTKYWNALHDLGVCLRDIIERMQHYNHHHDGVKQLFFEYNQ